MMHKAWSSIEEVPYCFWRSSVKYQGHTGWKIDDWNPIWVRLLGRSQLSNPSDLPCFKLAFFNVNVDILIQMFCPSYLLFFYLVVDNNINQQGPTSNPVPHRWSKPQHKNITDCKTYQRKNNQSKELNRLLILSNFIDKKRKTIGKLVNGHIKHDISFQTKNHFN